MLVRLPFLVASTLLLSCSSGDIESGIDSGLLRAFAPLPDVIVSERNPVTPEKVSLGRRLFHDPRFSSDGAVSCASCHPLDSYGADGKPLSAGHHGMLGERNAPTVYNAAGHFVQFWDGRAADVEEQAKGPVLNPVEMGMASESEVETVLRSDPSLQQEFQRAFPGETEPLTFDNFAKAIGAFERTLTTPSRWDAFLRGDAAALTAKEKAGFTHFTDAGCMTCHRGPYVGGQMYSRLGLVKGWPDTDDLGRYQVTSHERDRLIFKVPGLRNVAKTAPYLHDGSIETLEETVNLMAEYQLGKRLAPEDTDLIVTWLNTLTGEIPAAAQ